MKIVIDIPEEDYMVLEKWFRLKNLGDTLEKRIFCAVANGTVLPKGHGDLIDAIEVKSMYEQSLKSKLVDSQRGIDLTEKVSVDIPCQRFNEWLDNAPVVIPADKGE